MGFLYNSLTFSLYLDFGAGKNLKKKEDPMTDVHNGRAKDQRRAYMVDFLYFVNEYLSKQYRGLSFHILIQPLMEKE